MLVEIGKRLKEAREKKGLTLEDIEEETKIRRKYLRAMEEEQFQILPGQVYAKAFLKTYTRFLGIDVEDVFQNDDRFINQEPEQALPNYLEEDDKDITGRSRSRLFLGATVIIVSLVVLALFGGWAKDKNISSKSISGEPVGEMVVDEQTMPPANQQQLPVVLNPPTNAAPVRLDLQVKDRNCWMKVDVDGTQVFVGTLTPGQAKYFEGQEIIKVRFGDAGAVEASLNGRNLGSMGNNSDPVDREFTTQTGG